MFVRIKTYPNNRQAVQIVENIRDKGAVRQKILRHVGRARLDYVSDAAGTAGEDIGNQGAGNYTYNSIGQMTGNVADNQKLTYDAYGKVTEVHKTDNSLLAKYFYDDRGFRIKKEVYTTGDPQTTWYVRDVNGNMLTSYYKDGSNNTKLLETPVYGSSRIGLAQYNPDRTPGKYVYELTDHLGNVRAVVSKDGADAGTDIDILSATDYYPGGMRLPGRWYISENYRFGYQGQFAEKDPETGYNQFEARLYDARLGRWMAPDPINRTNISPYVGMGNNPILYGDPDGSDVIVMIDRDQIIFGIGHVALAIEDGEGGWIYYSKNQNNNEFFGWLKTNKPQSITKNADNLIDLLDKNKNEILGYVYDEMLRINTTSDQDAAMRKYAETNYSKPPWGALFKNCDDFVNSTLKEGEALDRYSHFWFPSSSFGITYKRNATHFYQTKIIVEPYGYFDGYGNWNEINY